MSHSKFVTAQMQRFEHFIKNVDLVKVGKKYLEFKVKNNNDGRYNDYVYLLRVLKIVAKVEGCMLYPKEINYSLWKTYHSILEYEALNAYIESLKGSK